MKLSQKLRLLREEKGITQQVFLRCYLRISFR